MAEKPSAKPKANKPLSDEAILERVVKSVSDAVGHSHTEIGQRHVRNFDAYMRKPYAGDEALKGKSRHVSGEIQRRAEWLLGQLIALFDSQKRVVCFSPNSAEDLPLAEQQTDVANHFLRVANKHVDILHPFLKNGIVGGMGIVTVDFVKEPVESLPRVMTGLTPEAVAELVKREEAGELKIVSREGEPYDAPMPPEIAAQLQAAGLPPEAMAEAAQALGLPKLRDVKVRFTGHQRRMAIENLAPGDYIVSRDAQFDSRGGVKARLQGHKRIMSRDELLEAEFDPAKVKAIPSASDEPDEQAQQRGEWGAGDLGVGDVEDDVTVYEIFMRLDVDGDGYREHVRLTLAGDLDNKPVLLNVQEVSRYAPYAVFVPFPMPNTLFGQGLADRIADDQRAVTKMERWQMDGLAMSVDPLKIVNPGVTNVEDVLSVHPGKVIRSKDPTGGISYNSPPFTAMNAAPIVQLFSDHMDLATGVGASMMALKASDLQNTTATSASLRNNASQVLVETIARQFSDNPYSHMVRLIVDQLAQYPEDAQEFIIRLRGEYVPIETDNWNADLDITSSVTFGITNTDAQAATMMGIIANIQAAIPAGMATPQNLYNAQVRLLEIQGIKNAELYFVDPSTLPPAQPQPPAPDPNMIAVQGQLQIEQERLALTREDNERKHQREMLKIIMGDDRERDANEADVALRAAEIGAGVNVEGIWARQEAQRNSVEQAMQAQQNRADQAMQIMQMLSQAQQAQQPQAPQPPQITQA